MSHLIVQDPSSISGRFSTKYRLGHTFEEDDLISFIIGSGGIDLSRGGSDFERFSYKECRVRGLVDKDRGLSPDHMREIVAEAGYPLPEDSQVDDLFTLLDRAVRGAKIYPVGVEDEPEEYRQDVGDDEPVPF